MKRILGVLLLLSLTQGSVRATDVAAAPTAPVSTSIANEAQAAINRGIDWLLAKQATDGSWSNPDFPALTALPLWAIAQSGRAETAAVQRAVANLLASANPDGSICRTPREQRKGGGLCNYNTAVAMVALNAVGHPDLVPVIQKARHVIAGSQHLGDDMYEGGMGYDPATGRPYADLSNSYLAFEAMRLTENVEDLRKQGDQRADLDWEAAQKFIQRVQNLPGSNDQPWASDDPAERGGFAYKPDSSMAGAVTNADGSIRLRSYGSMTYAGLLSFIYAKVDRDDERVKSAFEWTTKHWSLEENPGMGQQGLYYFYNVMAKALAAHGEEVIVREDGTRVSWREELIRKLIGLQKIEPDGTGYWVNSEGRWWEADPVLVTSYSLLALEVALPD